MRTLSKLSFLQWRNTIYQGVLLQSVYGQLPPRSWSTIGCHYSPQSLSSAATRIHHELPPRSRSTTTAIRCQHDRGSSILPAVLPAFSSCDRVSFILDHVFVLWFLLWTVWSWLWSMRLCCQSNCPCLWLVIRSKPRPLYVHVLTQWNMSSPVTAVNPPVRCPLCTLTCRGHTLSS